MSDNKLMSDPVRTKRSASAPDGLSMMKIETTEHELAKAFTEWDRRYREDPDAFESDIKRILKGKTPEDYGSRCGPYLVHLIMEGRIAKGE